MNKENYSFYEEKYHTPNCPFLGWPYESFYKEKYKLKKK